MSEETKLPTAQDAVTAEDKGRCAPAPLLDRLEAVVADLADPMKWNWMDQGLSERDAADAVLSRMASFGVIEYRRHPSGGNIWKVNGQLYGRLDGITLDMFDGLKAD